jgi:hypothetical protein
MEEESTGLTSRRRDIVIGVVILILVAVAAYFILKPSDEPEITIDQTSSVEDELEESFKFELPEDVEKVELSAVRGDGSRAIATRKFENGTYSHTVLADLPDPESGTFYEGWLVRGKSGDENFAIISTGQLTIAKGGYLLNFESSTDYSDYGSVVITLEKVADSTPEEHVLQGSF